MHFKSLKLPRTQEVVKRILRLQGFNRMLKESACWQCGRFARRYSHTFGSPAWSANRRPCFQGGFKEKICPVRKYGGLVSGRSFAARCGCGAEGGYRWCRMLEKSQWNSTCVGFHFSRRLCLPWFPSSCAAYKIAGGPTHASWAECRDICSWPNVRLDEAEGG